MPTQKDIAEQLGVSVSLVSRVLSGKAGDIGITGDTIRKVQLVAGELGYVPSAAARVLKGATAQTIGVVVFDFEDPFFGPIIGELQRLAHREHYALALAGFEGRQVHPDDLTSLLRYPLDGLIIVGSEPVASWIDPFLRQGMPVVRIGRGAGGEPVHNIGVDHAFGIRSALKHLRGLGHDTVGAVFASPMAHRQRFEGFEAVAASEGLEARSGWTATGGSNVMTAGEMACSRLLEENPADLPSAIMASSDLVAMGAIKVLHGHGMRIPGDISVVGFDDIPIARLCHPALTTIRQPVIDMVAAAFALVGEGAGAERGSADQFLRPELVIRESTAKPRSKP